MNLWGNDSLRSALVESFLALGFSSVALDLEGLVSGKLNRGQVGVWPA